MSYYALFSVNHVLRIRDTTLPALQYHCRFAVPQPFQHTPVCKKQHHWCLKRTAVNQIVSQAKIEFGANPQRRRANTHAQSYSRSFTQTAGINVSSISTVKVCVKFVSQAELESKGLDTLRQLILIQFFFTTASTGFLYRAKDGNSTGDVKWKLRLMASELAEDDMM
ncbi:LANO_0E08790g1_1 [Lachancea nothofagi CBS 11611]|uniref:LANO_0E08790g1_1 n=1 Tax=Lachancea nothofagi CBS 11611 TaxID=1266666 RepID=A0A1G4JV94_9SACH|nr:LANO_0E08790g1_1 [Lachancea nothofagi CBS 11611]